MIRDIQGKRVKKTLNRFQMDLMEKFYIFNKQIFQIVRIEQKYILEKEEWQYNLKVIKNYSNNENFKKLEPKNSKLFNVSINEKDFKKENFFKTYYQTLRILKNSLKAKEKEIKDEKENPYILKLRKNIKKKNPSFTESSFRRSIETIIIEVDKLHFLKKIDDKKINSVIEEIPEEMKIETYIR